MASRLNEKKRILILIVIMALATLIVAVITISMLYETAVEAEREVMISTAQSQARLIESIAVYESENVPFEQFESATLNHLVQSHKQFKGIGKTGEFTLAKLEGDKIVFLLSHRYFDFENPQPVPMDSIFAEPMRRALSGLSGSVIGLDYRGETVLAAYEPVAGLNYGIVAKIDLAEIKAPFEKASAVVLIITVLVVLCGSLLFAWITDPIIKQTEEHSRHLASLVETLRKREKELQSAHADMEQRVEERTRELARANEQLILEGQKRARVEARLRALWKLNRMVDFEEKELYDHILNSAINFTQSSYAFFGILSPDEAQMKNIYWSDKVLRDCRMVTQPFEHSFVKAGILDEAVRQRKVITVNHYSKDYESRTLPEGHIPLERVLAVPLHGNYGIAAVLAVVNKAEEYSQEEARQLEAFAIGAQVILEQREIKRQLEESEKKYSALVENSQTGIFISANGKILFVNRRFAEFYGFSVDELVDRKVDTFIHPEDLASFEEYERKTSNHESVPMNYSIRWIKKNGDTAWTTVSNVPIEYQGNHAIVWNVNDITPIMDLEDALRESEQECRLLSREVLKAQENERKRVAREIHDSISQSLAALKFRLEDYSITAEQKTGESSKDLKFIIGMLQKTLKEVSRIMNDLRPAGLDELGIVAAITDFCNDFQTTYPQMKISTKIEVVERDVPEQIKAPAFRVLQEALHNAAKHSEADTVEVRLFMEGDLVALQVKDNGVGFSKLDKTTQRRHIKGLGLYSMKERANLSGGSLEIHSSPGTGTVVETKWPLQSEDWKSESASMV